MVGRLNPFHRSAVPAPKFDPVTDSVKSPPPASVPSGETALMDGCSDPEGSGTRMSHMLRPCVAARKMRDFRCSTSECTTTRGSPLPKLDQVAPASVVTITPASVAMYRVSGTSGSTATSLTGMSECRRNKQKSVLLTQFR